MAPPELVTAPLVCRVPVVFRTSTPPVALANKGHGVVVPEYDGTRSGGEAHRVCLVERLERLMPAPAFTVRPPAPPDPMVSWPVPFTLPVAAPEPVVERARLPAVRTHCPA